MEKLQLFIAPTQSGKTFACINAIQNSDSSTIHIVFTMNTLIGSNQFATRVKSIIDPTQVVVIGSSYKQVRNIENLKTKIQDENIIPKVIICCSHGKRFRETSELCSYLQAYSTNICLHYDEIHHYAKVSSVGGSKLRSEIENLSKLDNIKTITGYTATPTAVWDNKLWTKIALVNSTYNGDNYVGVHDINWVNTDKKYSNTLEYVAFVLEKYPAILSPKARVFIPAERKQDTHVEMQEHIHKHFQDTVVIIINSVVRSLFYYEDGILKTHPLRKQKNKELCEVISEEVTRLHLEERAIVWTGYSCIGMGQTLLHKTLGAFTSCILVGNGNPIDLYQLIGRVTGRIADWKTDVSSSECVVYSPSLVQHHILEIAKATLEIAKMDSGEITREMYESIIDKATKNVCAELIPLPPKQVNYIICKTRQDVVRAYKENNIAQQIQQPDKACPAIKEKAPKALLIGEDNPTIEIIKEKCWGMSGKCSVRCIPYKNDTDDEGWVLYHKVF